MPKKFDVAIMGSGVTGLALGALLAEEGRKVLVLEKTRRLGGRARVDEKKGFTLDYGIHLVRFADESALAETCRRLGREVQFVKMGRSYVRLPGGDVQIFPTRPPDFLSSRLIAPHDLLKIPRYAWRGRNGSYEGLMETPVAHWMDELGIEGAVREYLRLVGGSMLVCDDMEKASAGEMLKNVIKTVRMKKPPAYPLGGWSPLFELFRTKIEKAGEVRLGTRVNEVLLKKGRAAGVVAAGKEIKAGAVVISLPCQELFRVLDAKAVPKDFSGLCRALRPTSGFSWDVCLDSKITADSGLWYISRPLGMGLFTSNLDPSLAPSGCQLFTFFSPAPLGIVKNKKAAEERFESIRRQVFSQFPTMEKRIVYERKFFMPVVDGVEPAVDQPRRKRPGYRVPGLAGLYLVGDSTRAEGAGGDVGHESVAPCLETMGRDGF